ncbi:MULTISPECIES: hypothetical protein [Amycolatopsis]|uniref:SRPBCC family protein n=1 Tax=Amycolatopsis dongchuanensis TaxID=1070866 RepID=A0ABP9QP64_9PSEU
MTETITPDRTVLTDKVLSHAVYTATIDAPIEKVDIAEWLRTLPDKEYQRCAPPDHKAAGYTVTDDGRPMSINVEMIGTGLVIQHYVYEIAEKDHCHMVSLSDVFTPRGWTTTQVIWDLKAERIDEHTSKYTNTVTSHPTADFMRFIEAQGQTFEEAAAARQAASGDHCRRETPLYAASIARHANRNK